MIKITKFPQSCLKIEKDNSAIMIDIGSFATAKFGLADFGRFDALLVTHQHSDHIDPDFVAQLKEVPIYANLDVADKFSQLSITVIEDRQEFEAGGFRIKALDTPHCLMPDGSEGPPHTSFIVDDLFFDAGDSVEPQNFSIGTAAIAVAGPSISLLNVYELAQSLNAKKIIPIHYDNPAYYNDPQVLKRVMVGVEVILLEPGQSTEL